MKVYRGGIFRAEDLDKLTTIMSSQDLSELVNIATHHDLDTIYHGQVLFVSEDFDFTFQMTKMRIFHTLSNPSQRRLFLEGTLVPVILELDILPEDIYTFTHKSTLSKLDMKRVKLDDSIVPTSMIVQKAAVKDVVFLHPYQLINAMRISMESATYWINELNDNSFAFLFLFMETIPKEYKEMLATYLHPNEEGTNDINRLDKLNSEHFRDLTFADIIYQFTTLGSQENPVVCDFVHRYLHMSFNDKYWPNPAYPKVLPYNQLNLLEYKIFVNACHLRLSQERELQNHEGTLTELDKDLQEIWGQISKNEIENTLLR